MELREQEPVLRPLLFEAAVERARADYLEMPGLRLTLHQARRLWMLDLQVCHAVLDQLVNSRFLTRSGTGLFIRSLG